MQQAAYHKLIIRDFYRRAVGQGDIAFAEQIIADDYSQHSQFAKPGKAGLLEGLRAMQQMPKPANPSTPYMRLIAEDEYVVTNLSFECNGQRKVVVDLFRFQDGLVAEHWDAMQDQPTASLNGNAMMDGPLPSKDGRLTQPNKALVGRFYQRVMVERHLDELANFVASDLIQHHPCIANGLTGLENYLRQQCDSLSVTQIHRLIAEGNFVVVQAEGCLEQQSSAFYDIFRVQNNQIVEEWSVWQQQR